MTSASTVVVKNSHAQRSGVAKEVTRRQREKQHQQQQMTQGRYYIYGYIMTATNSAFMILLKCLVIAINLTRLLTPSLLTEEVEERNLRRISYLKATKDDPLNSAAESGEEGREEADIPLDMYVSPT